MYGIVLYNLMWNGEVGGYTFFKRFPVICECTPKRLQNVENYYTIFIEILEVYEKYIQRNRFSFSTRTNVTLNQFDEQLYEIFTIGISKKSSTYLHFPHVIT